MTKLLAMTVFAVTCFAAVPQGGTKTGEKPIEKPSSPALVIPKDAVANPDGTWNYTDARHKKWIYVKTPFGVTRSPVADSSAKAPAGIPAGAQKNPDGTYAWMDKAGKKWTLSMTPFGISRAPAAGQLETRATDLGDTVRFERSGPMGNSVWEKKKTDLNDDDRRILAAQSGSQK